MIDVPNHGSGFAHSDVSDTTIAPSVLSPEEQLAPIATLGEDRVLAIFLRVLAAGGVLAKGDAGPGDDCAVLAPCMHGTLISTDMMVESVDFRRDTFSAIDLGWKIAAVNLSDIGAMGGVPTAFTISAALPDVLPSRDVEGIAQGIVLAIHELAPQVRVIGGDLSAGAETVLSGTVFGNSPERPILRSGARPGDQVAIAGQLGWAYVGWQLLDQAIAGSNNADMDRARRAQRMPNPPVALGAVAAERQATALIDVSDGLVQDALRICRASQNDIVFDPTAIQRFVAALAPVAATAGVRAEHAVLGGGEDFALLATFPPQMTLPDGFLKIGHVDSTQSEPSVFVGSTCVEERRGWSHFSNR